MSEIDDLLARLRRAGGDTADIEVKASAGGLSPSVTSTLCALANLPGGGWLVLGLDESRGFEPVGLGDVAALKQGVAGKSRACVPPVQVEFSDEQVDGKPVIVVRVAECPPSNKPCRVAASGQAWVRAWDGDYTMSHLEEQALLRGRTQPHFDREPVLAATMADLDNELVSLWSRTAADLDPRGLGRFDHDERLFRGGVVTSEGVPTKAGLLALGVHPQQFFPRYVVNLAAVGTAGTRAREPRTVSGPIPVMLDGALDWAQKTFTAAVVPGPDGALRDTWTYPLEAFRELVSNALVHRDLDAWSEGEAVEIRLRPDRLVVTSPGGLYGITVDRLGQEGTTSARNPRLLEVCRYTRSSDGARVVESLATGIPRVLETLRAGGHPEPVFADTGIRFSVVTKPAPESGGTASLTLSGSAGGQAAAGGTASVMLEAGVREAAGISVPRTPTEHAVWNALDGAAALTAKEISASTGLKIPAIRKALRALIEQGLVERHGGQGQRGTTYRAPGPRPRRD